MTGHCTLKVILHALPESPWKEIKGFPLNDRGLANKLRQYGIQSKGVSSAVWFSKSTQAKTSAKHGSVIWLPASPPRKALLELPTLPTAGTTT
jgi:Protein of unknown function (DUF3631)